MKQLLDHSKIPEYVTHVTKTLESSGFEAYLVGGCVRDLLMSQILSEVEGGREPKDWDVTTNAKPEEIIPLFDKTVYENKFGTVAVVFEDVSDETGEESVTHVTNIVEVTPYRTEAKYTDNRHPDEVKFSENIEEDLKRRDFTVNALAYSISKGELIDLFDGLKDIKDKLLRTVGAPSERFGEDALRMLRAVRFSVQLGFVVSSETLEGVFHNADLLKNISKERIRDEFTKIIMSPDPMMGIGLLSKLGLLKHFIPELEEGIKCEQKGEHIYDVYEHLGHALQHAAEKGWSLHIRLAALFHDIGKPRTRRWDGTKAGGKGKYTFYGHEVVGARMTEKILERLHFPKKTIEIVVKLVRYHMFFSDTEQITLSAVRRVVRNIGVDNIWDLMRIRECDRVGMKKKEAPYRLRKYHAMIEEVLHNPISVGQLAIDGNTLMEELHPPDEAGRTGMKPGPRMGWILHALLEEVLEDPNKNTVDILKSRALELDKLSDTELKALGEQAKEEKERLEEEEVAKLHKKHGV